MLVTAIIGGIVQTQFNLSVITQIAASVSSGLRMVTTAEDLLGFGPVMSTTGLAGGLVFFVLSRRAVA